MAPDGEPSLSTPRVRVVKALGLGGTTVVFVYGDHDFASRGILEEALAPLEGDVVVDLSWCGFADKAVVAVVLAKSNQLERDGGRVELVIPAGQRNVSDSIRALGLEKILRVQDTLPSDLRDE
jgi:hypothetical protein